MKIIAQTTAKWIGGRPVSLFRDIKKHGEGEQTIS